MAGIVSRALGMVARFVVTLVDDAPKMQMLQGIPGDGLPEDDLEHFQPYGFTAKTKLADTNGEGPEAILLAPGGDRSQGIVICVADRRYRLKPLVDGEVALYDDLDQRIHLTRTGIVIDAPSIKLGISATLGVARSTDPVAVSAGSLFTNLNSAGVDVAFVAAFPAAAAFLVAAGAGSGTGTITAGSAVVKAVN